MLRLATFSMMVFLGGCRFDGGIDAWEGVINTDIDQDGFVAGEEETGAAGDTLAYPDGVDRVYDLTVVGTTLWLWAEDSGDDVDGPKLIPLSLSTGAEGDPIVIQERPNLLNAGSELTWDGSAFWFTSDDRQPAEALLYQVDREGNVIVADRQCPFAGTTGCEGLAWDGVYLWTGEVNGGGVTRVNPDPGAAVPSTFSPWDDTTRAIDFLFAERTAQVSRALTIRNGRLYWILSATEEAAPAREVAFNRGGANQDTIWYPDDSERRIFTADVPPPP